MPIDEDDFKESHVGAESRGRGFLTQKDREFLLGEQPDLEDNTRYKKRERIRKRFENAILDFSVLYSEYGMELAADVLDSISTPVGSDDLAIAVQQLFGVLFYSLNEATEPGELKDGLFGPMVEKGTVEVFQDLASQNAGMFWNGKSVFEYSFFGVEAIDYVIKRYEDGTLLSEVAINFLVRNGEISAQEAEDYRDRLSKEDRLKMRFIDGDPTLSYLAHPNDVDLAGMLDDFEG